MSTKETAQEIFDEGIENGDSRDAIIVSMVQAGVSLNSAQNWYKDFAQSAGITTKRTGHKADAMVFIGEANVDLTDDATRADMKLKLQEEFGVASSTANDYVKAYAVENGIELPTASFGADPEAKAKIFNWICDNPNCDKSEFKQFMQEEMGRGQGSIDETWRGIVLARDLQSEGVVFDLAEAA